MDIAALSDYAKSDKKKLDSLRENKVLESDRLLNFATLLGREEADVEDVFSPSLYALALNQSFGLAGTRQLDQQRLMQADQNTSRLVKKAAAYFAVLPPEAAEFNHFTPAEWLFRNPNVLAAQTDEVNETLGNAERVISALNKLLG